MFKILDRNQLFIKPLATRQSKSDTSKMIRLETPLPPLSTELHQRIQLIAETIQKARQRNAPVMMAYGAHLFKNGLAPVVIQLLEKGYLQHLATNGAGSIHDWEMAFQGKTEENVSHYIHEGQFGIWEETGAYLNLAILMGSIQGLGYGASVGKMIHDDKLDIPTAEALRQDILQSLGNSKLTPLFSQQSNVLEALETFKLKPGEMKIPHPFKQYSIQHTAYQLNIPFSVCPGIGADIIYTHPLNNGAAIGHCALQDFLTFAQTVSQLEGGVFLSVGSAVMAPMIFEKAISMARNLALQQNRTLENYHLIVNDIQPGTWNWHEGEPPKDHPAYYLRFCKSFSRMGGKFEYLKLDNIAFLRHLHHLLLNPS
ncbi:hypothetical protein WDW89_01870 [Deltaproteobacteria bacterium TL4]